MIRIIKATTDNDIQKIADLANIIWHEHFPPIIGDAQVDYMVEKFQSYPAISNAVKNEGYIYYMAYYEDNFCGYIAIHPEEEKVFLSKIYIEKSYRGKKISKAMLNQIIADYPNAKALWLTVNRFNENSIAAYKKMGFEIIREQAADIGNGFVMDDYVMEKML